MYTQILNIYELKCHGIIFECKLEKQTFVKHYIHVLFANVVNESYY